jgi:hypothetical protein
LSVLMILSAPLVHHHHHNGMWCAVEHCDDATTTGDKAPIHNDETLCVENSKFLTSKSDVDIHLHHVALSSTLLFFDFIHILAESCNRSIEVLYDLYSVSQYTSIILTSSGFRAPPLSALR